MLNWGNKDEEGYYAKCALGPHGTARLVAERLGETGWDWQVWDAAGRSEPRYGVADSLDQAKERAWHAVVELDRQHTPTAYGREPGVDA